MPRRLTDQEVETRMVRAIADALKPVLIPVEQQCMQIQAENWDEMERLARIVWRAFMAARREETATGAKTTADELKRRAREPQ